MIANLNTMIRGNILGVINKTFRNICFERFCFGCERLILSNKEITFLKVGIILWYLFYCKIIFFSLIKKSCFLFIKHFFLFKNRLDKNKNTPI